MCLNLRVRNVKELELRETAVFYGYSRELDCEIRSFISIDRFVKIII